MAERRFPLHEWDRPRGRDSIPWALAERIYEDYAYLYGGGQSLERVADRGGFGWGEITLILVDAAERRERQDQRVKRKCEHEGCRNEFFVESADSDLVYCGRRDCAARVRPGGR